MQTLKLSAIKKVMIFLLALITFSNLQAQQASNKTTLLFQAIRSGSTKELQQQLSNGADVNDSLDSYSALMAATLNGSLEQMKLLIARGADVNYHSSDGTTALWLAIPDWDKTKLLLDNGADANHQIRGYGI
ncbi:MAG: ankyrin repeat domain-containing protein, partial [Ginsengibacter sp.]